MWFGTSPYSPDDVKRFVMVLMCKFKTLPNAPLMLCIMVMMCGLEIMYTGFLMVFSIVLSSEHGMWSWTPPYCIIGDVYMV